MAFFPIVLFLWLFLFCVAALLVGFVWGHRASFRRRGPLVLLFIALIISQILFIVTFAMFIHGLATRAYRGPGDFFSMAFWPFTTGFIAYLASWRLRRSINAGLASVQARRSIKTQ